jgi:plastocyanin
MAVYFVLGSILVAWGLGLAIYGLLRDDFPPSGTAGRVLIGATVVIVVATLTALLSTTKVEHPREEAAAEAAEKKEEQKPAEPAQQPAQEQQAPAPKPEKPAGKAVAVTEKEFSIALPSKSLKAGSYTFDVANKGQIQHDLTIDGDGVKDKKTKLISGGQSAKLSVKLKPAKYRFYCSVPGHEQAGMKVNVTVTK